MVINGLIDKIAYIILWMGNLKVWDNHRSQNDISNLNTFFIFYRISYLKIMTLGNQNSTQKSQIESQY